MTREALLEEKRLEQFVGTQLDSVLSAEESLYQASLRQAKIKSLDAPGAKTKASAKPQSIAKKLNYNTATEEDFIKIPGIGPVMANRLVRFRIYKGGRISNLDALLEVKGIGQKTLDRLKNHLKVE